MTRQIGINSTVALELNNQTHHISSTKASNDCISVKWRTQQKYFEKNQDYRMHLLNDSEARELRT